jgi:chromosome partitioning protein
VAIINQKGGVGKTTTAVNLSACLAKCGLRILVVDLDSQANATAHLGIDIHRENPLSVYDLLTGNTTTEDLVTPSSLSGLDVIPSHIELSGAEIELVNRVGRESILKNCLNGIRKRYDYIMVDCPPSLGLLTLNALVLVREVIIPVQTEFFALQGMARLLETINLVKRRLNPHLRITGVVACMYDSRTNLSKDVIDRINQYFGDKLFTTHIRQNVKLAEAPSFGQPIVLYAPRSYGAIDYTNLAQELIARAPSD